MRASIEEGEEEGDMQYATTIQYRSFHAPGDLSYVTEYKSKIMMEIVCVGSVCNVQYSKEAWLCRLLN
jgi:hypothetical protein